MCNVDCSVCVSGLEGISLKVGPSAALGDNNENDDDIASRNKTAILERNTRKRCFSRQKLAAFRKHGRDAAEDDRFLNLILLWCSQPRDIAVKRYGTSTDSSMR